MYMQDIQNRVHFGKMVHGRGSSGASSKKLWLNYISEIAAEIKEVFPTESEHLTSFVESNP